MDFDDIGSRLSNLTMYDVKQLYTAAKNYALNVSEIEAKVNEATSDDPWGASSTLMQEIAAATHNFQDFNEIMPGIYRNFMEREASEWRQIYKALQLLEYLIKHGSERVVDDARSHIGTIKILRNFHYIDEAAKDQGINVRNRAKEIAELLGDVERIRAERRKARANKQKYQGGSNADFVPGSGTGRYGGFGSDSFNSMGGAASYGGGGSSSADTARRDSFEAYDAGDDEDSRPAPSSASRRAGASSRGRQGSGPAAPAAKKKEEKVADLFSFDDDEPAAPSAPAVAASNTQDDFDEFDDFQGAPSAAAAAAAPASAAKPTSGVSSNVFDFLGSDDSKAGATQAPAPAASRPSAPMAATPLSPSAAPIQPQRPTLSSSSSATAASGAKNNAFNFDDLWASSSGKASAAVNGAGKGKMSMAEMAKQKSSSAVWGGGAAPPGASTANKPKDLFDFL